VSGYIESLIGTESGGNWGARNNETGAGGSKGHFGRVQFGRARLQEAMDAGAIPQGTTPEQFMASPELQMSAENWHFADLEARLGDLVGQTVNGQVMDMGSLVAMGHLGGAGGARKYVESGGQYNPSDSFGTSLSDYAQTHGGRSGNALAPPPDYAGGAMSGTYAPGAQRNGLAPHAVPQQAPPNALAQAQPPQWRGSYLDPQMFMTQQSQPMPRPVFGAG
jgi:hypothetical protein